MAIEAGSVFFRLGAKFEPGDFDKYDRAIQGAQQKKAIKAQLHGDYDPRAFSAYEKATNEAAARAKRKDAFKAALGGDFNARAFNQYERALKDTQQKTRKPFLARLGAHFDPRPWKQQDDAITHAESHTHGLEKASGKLRATLGGVAKTAIAAGSAYLGIAAAKGAIDTTKELAQTTLRLTGNTKFDVQTASQWAAVTKARGIDANRLGQTLAKLSKTIEGGLNGQKASVELWDHLGVSQKQLRDSGKDMPEFLGVLADKLHEMGPGTERTAIAQQLFGRSWQVLIPMLRDGSKALNDQLQTAEKYGATFGNTSAEKLKNFIKAQREAQFATMGLQVALGLTLAPVLTTVIQKLNGLVVQFRQGKGEGGRLKEVFRQIAHEVERIAKPMLAATTGVIHFAEQHKSLAKVAGALAVFKGTLIGLKFAGAITGLDHVVKAAQRLGNTKAGQRLKAEIVSHLGDLTKAAGGKLASFARWLLRGTGIAGAEAGAAEAEAQAAAGSGGGLVKRMSRGWGRFKKWLIGAGAVAGAEAGVAEGEAMAGSKGLTSSGIFNRFRSGGTRIGGVMGRALGAAAMTALFAYISSQDKGTTFDKIADFLLPFRPRGSDFPKQHAGTPSDPIPVTGLSPHAPSLNPLPTGTPGSGRQHGGPIGSPWDFGGGDRNLILAEDGEHMWTKEEVRAAGGHGAIHAMRRAVRRAAPPMLRPTAPVRTVVAPTRPQLPGTATVATPAIPKDAAPQWKKYLGDTDKNVKDYRKKVKDEHEGARDDATKRSKELHDRVTRQLKDTADDGDKHLKRLVKSTDNRFDDARKSAVKSARDTSRGVTKQFDGMSDDSDRSLRKIARSAKSRLEDARETAATKSKQFARAITGGMDSSDQASYTGLAYIAKATSSALKSLGAKAPSFSVPSPSHHAVGGIPHPGSGTRDDHILVAPNGMPVAALSGTEGIINTPQMGVVDLALAASRAMGVQPFGGLGELWRSGMTHHAKGGAFGGVTPAIASLIRRLDSSGFHHGDTTGPGHAPGGYHPRGMAVDWGDASNDLRKLWRTLYPQRGGFAELFGPSYLVPKPTLMHSGHGFSDAGLQADHEDHIHTAISGSGNGGATGDFVLPQWKDVARPAVRGPEGVLGRVAQGSIDKVRMAANRYGRKQADFGATGGGGDATANMQLGHRMMLTRWGEGEWPSLRALWQGESGWEDKTNPSSGARGIPQALPASKMGAAALAGNIAAQIRWGLGYIASTYHSPSRAYAAWQSRSPHWYALGGLLRRFAGGGLFGAGHDSGGPRSHPLFTGEGPRYYAAAYRHNRPFARPGPYQTRLSRHEEHAFRKWVQRNHVPFDVSARLVDYDMRGFWKSSGHWHGGHFPDTWKTPYDTTFSHESRYATRDNPFYWRGDRLIDRRNGQVVFANRGGLLRLAGGGIAGGSPRAGSPGHGLRSNAQHFLSKLWGAASSFYPRSGRPVTHIGHSGLWGALNFNVHGVPYHGRQRTNVANLPDWMFTPEMQGAGLSTAIHEWAHYFQSPAVFNANKDWVTEGGAQAFTRMVAPQAAARMGFKGDLGLDRKSDSYLGYARRFLKSFGPDFALHGQFGKAKRLPHFAGGGHLRRTHTSHSHGDDYSRILQGIAPSIRAFAPGLQSYQEKADYWQKSFDRQTSNFDRADAKLEFVTSPRDGSAAHINMDAIHQREGHIAALVEIQENIALAYRGAVTYINKMIARYNEAIGRLSRAMRHARGSRKKTIGQTIGTYRERISGMIGQRGEFADKIEDIGGNILDLRAESGALLPDAQGQLPQPGDTGDTTTGGTDPDLQAMLDQANQRLQVATETIRIQTAAMSVFKGPGDIGTGQSSSALQAAYAGGLPTGIGNVGLQDSGSGGITIINNVETLHPADPATLDAIGRASTAGMSLQGSVTSPRTVLGV